MQDLLIWFSFLAAIAVIAEQTNPAVWILSPLSLPGHNNHTAMVPLSWMNGSNLANCQVSVIIFPFLATTSMKSENLGDAGFLVLIISTWWPLHCEALALMIWWIRAWFVAGCDFLILQRALDSWGFKRVHCLNFITRWLPSLWLAFAFWNRCSANNTSVCLFQ